MQLAEDEINDDEVTKVSSLKLKWALGLNYKIYNGVHNMTNKNRKEIFYVVGNTGVIYDYDNNSQRLLQGHCNKITCTGYNREREIIVTADSGDDSMLVIWDANTGVPKKTIFEPYPKGVMALDISLDGSYIVTLSKAEQIEDQMVTLWRWEDEDPIFSSNQFHPEIKCIQRFVKFNDSQNQFVTTGSHRLVFWSWDPSVKGLEYYSPNKTTKYEYTQTVFIPLTNQAVTGTNKGIIIVWDISLIMEDFTQPQERRPIKQVNLMSNNNKIDAMKKNNEEPWINVLKIEGNFLVVGSSNGCVRFYDNQYRIEAWFEDIDIGSIHTISFSSETSRQLNADNFDKEKDSLAGEPFICPDFIVVDDKARVTLLKAELFEKIDKEDKKGQILLQSIVQPIVATSVRPHFNTIAISCENCIVYEWNFQQKNNTLHVLNDQLKDSEVPTCLNYSPNSKYLAVATKIGTIYMYQVETGVWQSHLDVTQAQKSTPAVTMQVFSPDSRHLATMDEDLGVTLFILKGQNWQLGGKIRVHYAPIRSISFGESMDERSEIKLRLFSISEDMRMAQYEVITGREDQSNKYNRLKLKAVFPIEQECFPTACIWYPINLYKENVLLTVNEQYKIKLWSMMKDNLKVCKKTCLGPTYGGQINKLLVLNSVDEKNDYQDKYLAYATKQKVVGIIKLPLDGNPNNTIGLIAHSGKITSINSTVDGKLFFTSGADDFCVNIWEVDFAALEENFSVAPNEDPFPELLEGGPTGQTMSDLKDFFYYSQIRSKDEHTTKARKLDGKVPLEAIANMMRSMGYYPTQKEIDNMQNEIKFSSYMENFKETVNELDLNMFLKLFVNHRPVYGITKSHISNALSVLKPGGSMSREELIKILTTEGQKMSMEEIRECEKILLGEGNQFPDEVDADSLCHKVLGFEDLDQEEEPIYEEQEEDEG